MMVMATLVYHQTTRLFLVRCTRPSVLAGNSNLHRRRYQEKRSGCSRILLLCVLGRSRALAQSVGGYSIDPHTSGIRLVLVVWPADQRDRLGLLPTADELFSSGGWGVGIGGIQTVQAMTRPPLNLMTSASMTTGSPFECSDGGSDCKMENYLGTQHWMSPDECDNDGSAIGFNDIDQEPTLNHVLRLEWQDGLLKEDCDGD